MPDVDVACPLPEVSGGDRHPPPPEDVKDPAHITREIKLLVVACFCCAFFVYMHNAKENGIHTTGKRK